jgi:hypothetical protein
MTVDYADWQAPQAHATAISITGVPLLTGKSLVFSSGLQTIAAGGTYVPGAKSFTQPGYEIFVSAFANVASANPFVSLELAWTDSGTGLIIARDTYICAASNVTSGWLSIGSGPTAADSVFLTATNLDGAHTMVFSIMILQNSRIYAHDSFSWDNTGESGLSIPGFTVANLRGDNSALGDISGGALAASGNSEWLIAPGYGGTVTFAIATATVTPSNLTFTVYPRPTSFYGATAYLWRTVPTAAATFGSFKATRSPMLFQVNNSSAVAGTVSFGFTVGQDG